jgi:hypothetical protein
MVISLQKGRGDLLSEKGPLDLIMRAAPIFATPQGRWSICATAKSNNSGWVRRFGISAQIIESIIATSVCLSSFSEMRRMSVWGRLCF